MTTDRLLLQNPVPQDACSAATAPASARARDRRYVWHPWSPLSADRAQLMLSHGNGDRVWDVDGREFIDASSLNSVCGYAHPDVAAAVSNQLLRLHGVDLSVASHEPVGVLAERLASYLPDTHSKTVFVNSGSEGFEAAVMIASAYWCHVGEPRSRIVAFSRGYHGSTLMSRSLSGLPRVGHSFAPPLTVTHVELPVEPRELRRVESLPLLLRAFERAIGSTRDGRPMAVVVEPLLNVGGGVVLPVGFLRGLRELCDATGTLLILDEVFTGYGRTGRMFAYEHEAITPDVLVSSKGLGSGYMPIAAVTVHQRIHDSFVSEPFIGGLRYGHTTSGHAGACAAALATLDVIEREHLLDRAQCLGRVMLAGLAPLEGAAGVTDVRGLGLVLAVEMDSFEVATEVVKRARDRGLLLRQSGEVILVVPPLIIDRRGVSAIVDRIKAAVAGGAG